MVTIENTERLKMIEKIVARRLKPYLDILASKVDLEYCWVGGSSLIMDEPNDIDLFPDPRCPHFKNAIHDGLKDHLVFQSANADTYVVDGKKIQACSHAAASLEDLLKSFDFAHVQIGATIHDGIIEGLLYTQDYHTATTAHTTYYTGTDFPLTSLIRLHKYTQRGLLTEGQRIYTTFEILADLANRGFTSYDDFCRQILGMDPAMGMEGIMRSPALKTLFEALNRG
jgi:hypothetical protein